MHRQVGRHAERLLILGISVSSGNRMLTWTLTPSVDFVIPQRSDDADATWMLNDVLVPDLLSTSNVPFMSSVLKPGNSTSSTSSLEASPGSSWCEVSTFCWCNAAVGVGFSGFETANLAFEAAGIFHGSYIPPLLTNRCQEDRPTSIHDTCSKMLAVTTQ